MKSSPPGLDDLNRLNSEIAALVRAGIPLELGLQSISTNYGGRLEALTGRLSERISEGRSLADALDMEGDALPPVYGAMVRAGVASGDLPSTLESLAESGLLISGVRQRVAVAIVYPILCLIFAYFVISFLFCYILPLALNFSDAVPRAWWVSKFMLLYEFRYFFVVGVPALVTVGMALIYLFRNGASRTIWRHLTSFHWALGPSLEWAQFMDLLGLQVRHQAPLPQSFQLAADSIDNSAWQKQARNVVAALEQGRPFEEALKSATLMPSTVRWMLASGERQGILESTLHQLSDLYRRRALNRAAVLKVWLPVLITIAVTVVVGLGVGMSFFVPLRIFLQGLAIT